MGAVADEQRRRALLGRLARLGWFARHGEVAATQAMAILLEEPQLRDALLRHLGQMTQTDLHDVRLFESELVHDDRARPDLEGRDGRGRPLVVVEAKFGAALTSGQLHAYLSYQYSRLDGGDRGALIVLVPSYRTPEAEAVLGTLETQPDEWSASTSSVSAAVLTWDDLLAVWDDAAQELPADERDDVACDLRQLRELCKTMAALDVPPLGLVAAGRGLQERESDLRRLVAEATAGFPGPSGRLIPIGMEAEFNFYRRYIPGSSGDPDCYCAVGVVGSLAGHGTPFWIRYHRKTSSFQAVADHIMASRLAVDARGDGGHIWLPLHVSADRSGTAIVAELLERIEEIRAIAAGDASAAGPP